MFGLLKRVFDSTRLWFLSFDVSRKATAIAKQMGHERRGQSYFLVYHEFTDVGLRIQFIDTHLCLQTWLSIWTVIAGKEVLVFENGAKVSAFREGAWMKRLNELDAELKAKNAAIQKALREADRERWTPVPDSE